MILAHKTKSQRVSQGFTLLEIIITISLIVLLLGFTIVSFQPDSPSEKMKKATVELEALSGRGHTMAMLHQKPFWLRFERNRVLLQGAELTSVDTSGAGEFGGGAEGGSVENGMESLIVDYDSYEFPEGLEIFVRRWGASPQAWFHQEKKEDPVIFWNFEQSGLCEPLSLRMEIEKSWVELEMDPLTARVADETSEIYN